MSATSKSQSAPVAASKPKYAMPTPPPVVVWRSAPGAEPAHAIVTGVGRSAVNLMLFPPDSRTGVPKDSVRYIGDPILKSQPNFDAGIWDFTEESKAVRAIAKIVVPDNDGNVSPLTQEMIEFLNRVTK